MIYYLLLLVALPLSNTLQNIAQKQYSMKKENSNVYLFSAVTTVVAMCFFIVTSGFQLDFTLKQLPYSLAFAVSYAVGWVTSMLALQYGSMALTSLIISLALVFPTLYGILQGEAVTVPVALGFALLVAAMVLVNLNSKGGYKFSMKWFICAIIPFFTNGVCGISQTMNKQKLGDAYSHEFMIVALAVAAVMLFAFVFLRKGGADTGKEFRVCVPFALANGVGNALVNFLMLFLIGNIPNTVLFPTNSALGMAAAFMLAYFIYKERFSKTQYIGYVLGAVSVVLLNL